MYVCMYIPAGNIQRSDLGALMLLCSRPCTYLWARSLQKPCALGFCANAGSEFVCLSFSHDMSVSFFEEHNEYRGFGAVLLSALDSCRVQPPSAVLLASATSPHLTLPFCGLFVVLRLVLVFALGRFG